MSADHKTIQAHNAQLSGFAAGSTDGLRLAIAEACKVLEDDMWTRLKRHADVADLKVVIDRAIEEWSRK